MGAPEDLLRRLDELISGFHHLTGKESLQDTHCILFGANAWELMWDYIERLFGLRIAGGGVKKTAERYGSPVAYSGIPCFRDPRLPPDDVLLAGVELAPWLAPPSSRSPWRGPSRFRHGNAPDAGATPA